MQTFEYSFPNGDQIVWSVDKAMDLVRDGQVLTLMELPRDQMLLIAQRNEWSLSKLEDADPSEPGIAAPIIVTRDEQPQLGPELKHIIYVLIDGTHRCVRALCNGVPFKAHILTDQASSQSILLAPAWRVPGPTGTGSPDTKVAPPKSPRRR